MEELDFLDVVEETVELPGDSKLETKEEIQDGLSRRSFSGIEDEHLLSWETYLNEVAFKIMSQQSEESPLKLGDVLTVEKLVGGGFMTPDWPTKLKDDVQLAMEGAGCRADQLEDATKEQLTLFKGIGNNICQQLEEFDEFMTVNDYFCNKKTEFLICHADPSLSVVNKILELHRQFMIIQAFQFDDPKVVAEPPSLKKLNRSFTRSPTPSPTKDDEDYNSGSSF